MIAPRAALYVPSGIALDRCLTKLAIAADTEGWQVAALVRSWEDLAELMCDRRIDVGVVPSRDHLPPARLPRIEALDDLRRRPASRQRGTRTRRARRLPPEQSR